MDPLSHYFIRAIKPHGHLHTFDFHEGRSDQAREEFKGHGIENFVTVCPAFIRIQPKIKLCHCRFTTEMFANLDLLKN